MDAPCTTPGSLPLPLCVRTLHQGSVSSWGWWQTGEPHPALELWECTLPNGPVALAGSLSQPICSSSPADSTLAAFVTARLSTQGCSPLGIREKTLKPEQILAQPEEAGCRWEPFLCLPSPHTTLRLSKPLTPSAQCLQDVRPLQDSFRQSFLQPPREGVAAWLSPQLWLTWHLVC